MGGIKWTDRFCPLIKEICKGDECSFWLLDGVDDIGHGSICHPCSITVIGYHLSCLENERNARNK